MLWFYAELVYVHTETDEPSNGLGIPFTWNNLDRVRKFRFLAGQSCV